MSRTPQSPAELLMLAAIGCPHEIDSDKIILTRVATLPNNALNQLKRRLEDALPRVTAAPLGHLAPAAAVEKALALARMKAKDMREGAGFDGRYDDGGAAHLEALCAAYTAGLRRETPEFLREYLQQAEREADPEWAQYQRLQAKFGGKGA